MRHTSYPPPDSTAPICDTNTAFVGTNSVPATNCNCVSGVGRLYVLPSDVGGGDCTWDGLGTIGCDLLTCASWVTAYSGDLISHELGHNLGLNHASTDTNNDGVKVGCACHFP